MDPKELRDPLKFAKALWPHVRFYDKQVEILYSVVDNDETFVPAGNMLGKDFVTAFVVLWFFLTREPCRVITTSVDSAQLEGVLWGEMRRFIAEAAFPLTVEDGGPLVVNHQHIRKLVRGRQSGLSYIRGRVCRGEEGMLGHHCPDLGDGVPRTMWVADEASGVDDPAYNAADTWADRKLVIGNCYPCSNFFYRGVEGGDVPAELGAEWARRIALGEDVPAGHPDNR